MQDLRRVSFSKEELLCAFEAYSRKTPGFLPEGLLLNCTPRLTTEEGCSISATINTPSGNKELVFRDTEVLQVLILFCIENNVMLPRDGQKLFVVMDAHACLLVELNLDLDLGLDPMTTEDIANLKK